MTPPYPELLSLVESRSAVFLDAAAAAPDLAARVPGCPEWSLRDLIGHLGRVQRFWAATVAAGDVTAPPAPPGEVPVSEPVQLLEWYEESAARLLTALRATGRDAPSWTWWADSGAPMTAGAVARHQVQEAAVHAYDVQDTLGKPEPLPAAVAVDGVAEFLAVCLGSRGRWPHRPARVEFRAVEGPSWTVDLAGSGARLEPAASGAPVTRLHATASNLVLALYGRVPLTDVRIDGDREVAGQLREWAASI